MVALLAWALMLARPTLAETPTRLSSEMAGNTGAIGPHRAELLAAIMRWHDADRVRPYVAYIRSFSPPAIEAALRQVSWPEAGSVAANGFAAVKAGRPVPAAPLSDIAAARHGVVRLPLASATSDGASGLELAAIAAGAVVLLALLPAAARRLSDRGGRRGRGGGRGHSQITPPPSPTTAELEAEASHVLVATDDAVKTSQQELGFATARFGEHAAAPFSAALRGAQAELAAAFKLRQQLDDGVARTEPVKRSMLSEISARCMEANWLLDEQSVAFDRLQDLEARAPRVLAEVSSHIDQQNSRSAHSRQTLSQLAAKYTPAAVAVVTTCPDQAGERLEFARERVANARKALADDSRGEASVHLQAAESAADQAEALLDGIEHMEAELTRASSALPTALREIDADIANGKALLAGQPDDRAAAVTRAEVAASAVRGQLSAGAPFDVLAALRTLEEADTGLDHALASARAERERRDRARAVLDQAMLVARSSVTAAEDFITTRRGGIGAAARTRLAEAQRHYQQAIAYASDDPEAALAEAQHADALGREARSLAEQDVAEFSYEQHQPVAVSGGFGGAVLGGILIDSMFGGTRRIGGLGTLGSFGGIGTRGRHSIGGMF